MRLHMFATALIIAGAVPAFADPSQGPAGACRADETPAAATDICAGAASVQHAPRAMVILLPEYGALGDIHGARGPDPHARELREIALAASIGNHEKALIGARAVRKFGVTAEAVQDAVDQAQVHTGSQRVAKRRFFVIEHEQSGGEPGWENSQ